MAKWNWAQTGYHDEWETNYWDNDMGLVVRQAMNSKWWAKVISDGVSIEIRDLESEEQAKQVAEELGEYSLALKQTTKGLRNG
jgi:hypothetical protein